MRRIFPLFLVVLFLSCSKKDSNIDGKWELTLASCMIVSPEIIPSEHYWVFSDKGKNLEIYNTSLEKNECIISVGQHTSSVNADEIIIDGFSYSLEIQNSKMIVDGGSELDGPRYELRKVND